MRPPSLFKVGAERFVSLSLPEIYLTATSFFLHTATPQIIIPSQQENDLKQLVGDSCIFSCTIAGIPTPTVAWYHDDVELHSGRRISITRVSPSMATLTISGLTVDDTGMYQCFASNVVGRTQHSWALQVRTPGKVLVLPTHIYAYLLKQAHVQYPHFLPSSQQYLLCQPHLLRV